MSTPDTKLDEILGNLLALGEMYSLDDLKEIKADIEALIQEARIEQSVQTSKWIEGRIKVLNKDPNFVKASGHTALVYAADQARQGAKQAVLELKATKEKE